MKHIDSIQKSTGPWGEQLSALVDGELSDAELAGLLDALDEDPEVAAAWGDYHLVGNVLRGGVAAVVLHHDARFVQGVCDRIAAEPRSAPAPSQPSAAVAIAPVLVPASGRTSANDSAWRWKIVAGISVLGMASVLGWHLVGARAALGGPQLARVQAVPSSGGMVMIRDPQLDALIAAHQEQGGNSALQTPAGFLRNAAFERPAP